MDPSLDGITHINIYTKGKTELGRLLTNLAPVSFIHPDFGYFECMEAFWYWYLTGQQHHHFKNMKGFEVKKLGQKYREDRIDKLGLKESDKKAIILAIRCKLKQNPEILKLMRDSELPFTHYYWYGDLNNPKVYELGEYKWMIDYFEKVRNYLKGKNT